MNATGWRYGVPKAHNEFAVASLLLGAVGALAIIAVLATEGLFGSAFVEPSLMAALFDSVPRLLMVATACALVAVVVGALGVKSASPGLAPPEVGPLSGWSSWPRASRSRSPGPTTAAWPSESTRCRRGPTRSRSLV